MEFDMTKMVEKITMQVKESQEEFIFETINPYCEDILQIKINKEELKQILLNGKRNLQTSEDCISREEAIRIAEQGQIQGYEWQFKKLCDLPPIIPKGVTVTDFADRCRECGAEYGKMLEPMKPKGGHWVSSSNGWMCSNCREDASHEFDFCPHCGADMRVTREVRE